jgi:hypothetical protein
MKRYDLERFCWTLFGPVLTEAAIAGCPIASSAHRFNLYHTLNRSFRFIPRLPGERPIPDISRQNPSHTPYPSVSSVGSRGVF